MHVWRMCHPLARVICNGQIHATIVHFIFLAGVQNQNFIVPDPLSCSYTQSHIAYTLLSYCLCSLISSAWKVVTTYQAARICLPSLSSNDPCGTVLFYVYLSITALCRNRNPSTLCNKDCVYLFEEVVLQLSLPESESIHTV